jgi:outer membrane murein-binding lipoprotein Lpp
MDPKVNEIERTVKDIAATLARLNLKIDTMERELQGIYREVGAGKGRDLETQISGIEAKLAQMDPMLTETARDARAARKLVEYGDVRLKEIMQALSIIYRNTDELEANLLDADTMPDSTGQ